MIVEHHREVIALADHIVDMGPEAGINGGQIMYQGSYENLLKADTVTGRMLRTKTPMKMEYRKPTGWYQVEHAKLHNLKIWRKAAAWRDDGHRRCGWFGKNAP